MGERTETTGNNRTAIPATEANLPIPPDKDLISAVKGALLRKTESAGIDVQVAAEHGTVRLHGVVDVLSQKRAAEEIASGVPFVRHIENDISVANEEGHGDKDLLEAVTDRLAHGPGGGNIGCRVHGGKVTLVGHAATYDEVEAAVRVVEGLAGVRSVRVERVKVGEGRDDDDAAVVRSAQHLLAQLGYDHRQFQVFCDAGVLFVKGFVRDRGDRSQIKTALHTLRGVDRVEATLISDEQMADEIR